MAIKTLQSPDHPRDPLPKTLSPQVDFDLEPEDLLVFITYHYVESKDARRQRLLLTILGFGILTALPLMAVLGSSRSAVEALRSVWPLALGPLIYLVCFPFFTRRSNSRTCQRLLKAGDRRGYYGPRTLSLEIPGIRESTVMGDAIRPWSLVRRIVTVRHHALIYTSSTEAFVVPERAFADRDAFEAFLDQAAKRAKRSVESA